MSGHGHFFNHIDTSVGGPIAPENLERAFLAAMRELRAVPAPTRVVFFRPMPWHAPIVNDPRTKDQPS